MKNTLKKFWDKYSTWIIIGSFLILAFLTISPMLKKYGNILFSDDFKFHLARITTLYDSIKAGDFFPMVHSTGLNNYGYGYGFYYSNVLLYPAILLRSMGISNSITWIGLMFFYTLLQLGISFSSFFSVYKDRFRAYCFALIYTFGVYHFVDLYMRAEIAEYVALAFVPLVIAGCYHIIHLDSKKWWLLSCGMIGLIYAHMLSAIMATGFVAIYFLVNYKVLKDKERVRALLKAVGISVLVTIAFFGPLLEQILSIEFVVGNEKVFYCYNDAKSILTIFTTMFTGSEPYAELGLATLVMGVILLVSYKKITKDNAKLLGIALFLIIMLTPIFPWYALKDSPLDIIQFPWRLITWITVLIPWVFCSTPIDKKVLGVVALASLLWIPIISPTIAVDKQRMYFEEVDNDRGEAFPYGRELLHKGEKLSLLQYWGWKIHILPSYAEIEIDTSGNNSLSFHVNSNVKESYLVPKVYYVGYKAKLEGTGKILDLYYDQNGQIVVDAIGEGVITVYYQTTKIQMISFATTIAGLVGILGYLIKKKVKP